MAKAKAKPAARRAASSGGPRDAAGMKGWLGTVIVLVIPVVGLAAVAVWVAGRRGSQSRRGLCKAWLGVMARSSFCVL